MRAAEQPLVFRADADARMGMGHVMRCLALAQAWQAAGHDAILAIAAEGHRLASRWQEEGLAVRALNVTPGSADDATHTASLARNLGAAWVVLDGYHFSADYHRGIKQAGLRTLLFDDYGHAADYGADLVLNQNLGADEALYENRDAGTRLLVGSRYAVLRREFLPWRGWSRPVPAEARKVLVTFGGADSHNLTQRAVKALSATSLPGLEVILVAGAAYGQVERLNAVVASSPHPIELRRNVTDMPQLMAWADVAIGAPGSASWERAFMQLPSLNVVLADNQRPVAAALGAHRMAVDLGWCEEVTSHAIASQLVVLAGDADGRRAMAQRGRQQIDGEGADRVVQCLAESPLRLRDADAGDCRILWEWANDPVVREASFSSDPIPWPTHQAWFEQKLADPPCRIYVGLDREDRPVGQVRFDFSGPAEATVSIVVAAEWRGHGFGSLLLSLGQTRLTRDCVDAVHALIKPENVASRQTFVKAGYREAGRESVAGQEAIRYVLDPGRRVRRAIAVGRLA